NKSMASQESSAGFEQVVLVNSECANCGGSAQYLCQACGQTGPRYCSLKCQSDHWAKEHATVCAGAHSDTESEDHDSERSSRNLKRTSSKVYSRGTVAQLINFRKRRSTPEPPASPTLERLPNSNDLPPVYDAVQADEFRFYMHQVYRIIKPVVLCIVLSILWVKLAKAPSYFVIGSNTSSSSSNQGNDDSPSSSISSSVYMAGILIGQIIVATIVIVFLFKYGFTKEHYKYFFNTIRLYHSHIRIMEFYSSGSYICFLERPSTVAASISDNYVEFDGGYSLLFQ
ncbi:3397_t:CDS:2, partial [Scutellospora calospora]